MRYFYFFIFLFYYQISFGQTNPKVVRFKKVSNIKDNLVTLLKKAENTKDLTASVQLYSHLLVSAEKFDEDEIFCETALSYSKRVSKNINFFKVAEVLQKALGKAENLNNKLLIARLKMAIGLNYYDNENPKEAIKQTEESEILFKNQNENFGLIRSITIQGNSYLKILKPKKSLERYFKAYEISKRTKDTVNINHILNSISVAYDELKDVDSAFYYNKKAIELNLIRSKPDVDLKCSLFIEKAYLEFLQKQYYQSIESGKIALGNCPTNNLDFKSYSHRVLFRAYNSLGDYKNALTHYQSYIELRDSLSLTTKKEQFNGLNAINDNEKNEFQMELMNANLKASNRQALILSIALGLFSLFIYFIWQSRKKITKQKDEIDRVNDKLEDLNNSLEEKVVERTAELETANIELINKNKEITEALFKGQSLERKRVAAELHDNLGSTLSSINWSLQALDKDKFTEREAKFFDNIISMTKNAYSDVRTLSHNMLPTILEEKGIISAIEKLVNDLNENKKIAFNFHTNIEKPFEDKQLELNIYAIILELVNNTLKHSEATEAKIKLDFIESQIHIKCIDNGKGIAEEKLVSGKLFENLENRIKILNGLLSFYSKKNNTEFRIVIPYFLGQQ